MNEPLLLDTHVWVWALERTTGRLRDDVFDEIDRAASAGAALVSAVSAWELALLVRKGRLALSRDLRAWIAASREAPGVHIVPLGLDAALESVALPGLDDHADSADRFLLATARTLGARLVTCDERLLRYGGAGHVLMLDARP